MGVLKSERRIGCGQVWMGRQKVEKSRDETFFSILPILRVLSIFRVSPRALLPSPRLPLPPS